MYVYMYMWAGSALRSRTVRQKEKKRSFVVLERRSIHKSCPRTHNPVLFLWRIVIMQGQWRIQRHVLGDIVKNNMYVYTFMYIGPIGPITCTFHTSLFIIHVHVLHIFSYNNNRRWKQYRYYSKSAHLKALGPVKFTFLA